MTEKRDVSPTTARRFKHIEQEMRNGLLAFANGLKAIHSERLYLAEFDSFEDYVAARFNKSRSWAYGLISHSQVMLEFSEVSTMVDTQTQDSQGNSQISPEEVLTERHTREVAGLPAPEQKAVLEKAIETAPKDDSGKPKVTAEHVRQTRDSQPSKNGKGKSKGKGKAKTKPKTKNPAGVADGLRKSHVGPLVRGIKDLAKLNGGEGANYNAARVGLEAVENALQEMRKGEQ